MKPAHNDLRLTLILGLAALILTLAGAALAGLKKETIFTVKDPFGDDHGDGSMRYPQRTDLERGDFDLLEFSALRRGEDTVFRAVFANKIEAPGSSAIDGLGTGREDQARLGFYGFNIDIYIDTDRQPGSGEVAMLPGRRAEVAPLFAWEKVVAITPRPEALRASIVRLRMEEWREETEPKRSVDRRDVRQRRKQIREELLPLIYFPTRVDVQSRQIDVFIPNSFLGGPAREDWAYVVAISGARLDQRLELPVIDRFFGDYSEESSDGLVMPVIPGPSLEAFGGGRPGEPLQPPLIDILVPPEARLTQAQILGLFDSKLEQPAQIPGVVPADW